MELTGNRTDSVLKESFISLYRYPSLGNNNMREIVTLQLGQCGNNMGKCFWEELCGEHGVSAEGLYEGDADMQLDKIDVFYRQGVGNRYVPRAVLADMEPSTLDNIRESRYGRLYRPDNYISGVGGSGNNWAKGFYSEGAEILDQIMDSCRKEAETSDNLHGFQLTHSLGGGTGSGLGSLLLSEIRKDYPNKMIFTYSVATSDKVCDSIVEPYNTVLGMHYLIMEADACFIINNEALFNICQKRLKLSTPTFSDLNYLVSSVMSSATCGLRFPGQLNSDMRKLAVNLIPFPRLHFFQTGYAPLPCRSTLGYTKLSIPELTQQLFEPQNSMCAINPRRGIYITAALMYRGKVSSMEAEQQAAQLRNKSDTASWIPDNISTSMCDIPQRYNNQGVSAAVISNNSEIKDVFIRMSDKFNLLYKKKAYLHAYTDEGVDDLEFVEADSNTLDLVAEYQAYEDATVEGDWDSEYEEE